MVKTQPTKNRQRRTVNVHEHHRERMLEKFRTTSPTLFHDHEILEMILFFSRPRINTNDIAHRLIEKFGSFKNVFEADLQELTKVEGIGICSATQLKLIHECALRCAEGKKKHSKRIDSVADAGEYFVEKLGIQKRECVMVLLMDNNDAFLDARILFEGVVNYTPLNFRKIFEYVSSYNAAAIYIAHNHPNGKLIPSKDDIQCTKDLKSLCFSLDVDFKDHILVAGKEWLSILDYMVQKNS
ncbi:MAG: RadC family protein [Eubacteriales bacterium]